MREEVTLLSAQARTGFGGHAADPVGLSPAARETVEAIVRAMGAGDDVLIGRLLNRFTQIADFDALVHLRARLHTTLRATAGAPEQHGPGCARPPPASVIAPCRSIPSIGRHAAFTCVCLVEMACGRRIARPAPPCVPGSQHCRVASRAWSWLCGGGVG